MEAQRTDGDDVHRSMVSAGLIFTASVNPPAGELRVQELQRLLWQVAVMLPEMPLRDTDRAEARAELRTVQAQLGSPRPKLTILRESLHTIRGMLAGIPDAAGYGYLVQTVDQLAP
ncbi:hypothetical protein [Longimicrobium terrae]|uniref:Uncharacterized protein n=1 Tax=Longimicrobium terrae TaxID=1639882 RepID=A0A841GWN7_9BACT|nr:hypothetical protein [Longimicrobium terrae]MBB4634334.1 hypothetical protein [Longimicrobium terrae]MBB6068776.1 hypothetical protein [Longimicrobium terrae]NNC27960.1 hypothetical protein [Longimicrobium terrae]